MAGRGSSLQRRHNDGKPRFKPLKPKPRPSSSRLSLFLPYLLAFLVLLVLALAVLLFFKPFSQGQHGSSVYDRGLVTSDLSYKDVLSESGNARIDRTKRHFNASVLAYVTPWNSKGYDMAKMFREKFTHVSPVWYQLKSNGENLQLHGRHDVDQNWIDNVRIKGRPLIMPRVMLEGWPLDTMLVQQDERKRAMSIITSECKSMQYDGIVLEAWSAWAASGILDNAILRQKALHFVRELGFALHKVKLPRPRLNLQLIFVIPPPASKKTDASQFTAADIAMLGNAVDGFSLMTYDFSNVYRPGPNAPLPWLSACWRLLLGKVSADKGHEPGQEWTDEGDTQENNLAPKLLTGLNFYGNDFLLPQGGGAIIGHQYLSLLKKHRPTMMWDDEAKEHSFEYSDGNKKHIVYYPTLKSLALRLEAATTWGTGISIWEIGQGLEYFFDLL